MFKREKFIQNFFIQGKRNFFALFIFLFMLCAIIVIVCTLLFLDDSKDEREQTTMLLAKQKNVDAVLSNKPHDFALSQKKKIQQNQLLRND